MNQIINVTMECVCMLFTLMILFYLRISSDRKDRLNRLLVCMCVINIGMLLGDIPNLLCQGFAKPWFPAALKSGIFVQYICGCLAPWVYSLYLYTYLSKKIQMKRWVLPVIHIMFAINAVLLVLNFFNEMYYYIDEYNCYQRSELYWLSQAIPVSIIVFDVGIVLRYRHALRPRDMVAFLIYQILPIIGITVQAQTYGIATTYLSCSMAIFIIFLCIQSEQRLISEQQKRDLDKAHLAVMLSQIRPHFLYNSLLGIKQLCDIHPQKASDALEHFAYYLRGNLYSISDTNLIPFTKELEHLKNYLYLEKMRFEERLNIQWQIGYTDFLLPPLTLQPIVENAVRHGLMKRVSGGTLTIQSEIMEDMVMLTIVDNGVGFDTRAPLDMSRPHIGLENVKKRLETQCGATLEIYSNPGAGTRVEIALPGNKKR